VFVPHGRGCALAPQWDRSPARPLGQGRLDARWFARDPALFVAGGGDTLSALAHAGALEKLSYVSTAGGAFLEWLEG
jgi:Phosphoglycerate kinase